MLSQQNITELVKNGHQYILGARLRTEKNSVKEAILALGLAHGESKVIHRTDRTRLIVNCSAARMKKDQHNRARGMAKLQAAMAKGKLTKAHINNRGYNKYLKMTGQVTITIDQEKFEQDRPWDGLKGYVTNTSLEPQELIDRYKDLWRIEKAFRMSKTDLRIRPIYHRRQRRIEAHLCICFAAYKVYKELERQLLQKQCDISIERAVECLKTIYGITIKHPASARSKTMLFHKHPDQEVLVRSFEMSRE